MSRSDVALFVTCLVENVKPAVGFSSIALLEDAGYKVIVPRAQTCCGQPNYNGGDPAGAAQTARQVIDTFSPFNYTVVPSGSCAGMIKHHYPSLFTDDADYQQRAVALAEKTFELSDFLVKVAQYQPQQHLDATVTYHDACAGLRELDIQQQPRQLLKAAGVNIAELQAADSCCGFGGTFCVKYPEISAAMAERKVQDVLGTGASTLVMGDLGCMLNVEGKLHRDGHKVEVKHFAELLASDSSSLQHKPVAKDEVS